MALLALVASVLAWVSPTQAQNALSPIAIGSSSVAPPADATTPAVVTLDGSQSFDPDNGGSPGVGIAGWKWEVVTDAYSWINLTPVAASSGAGSSTAVPPRGFHRTNQNATFDLPSASLAARYGNTIEFRLTVSDDDNPAATASTTVTFNVNQGPTADIAVSANVANPDDIKWYDDDGNGVRDDNDEIYSIDGIIDGPGENGNADNEWDIMEGSRLILDGSGSTDPDGRPILEEGHDWDLVFRSDDGDNDQHRTAGSRHAYGNATGGTPAADCRTVRR